MGPQADTASIKKYLLEETRELAEAIDSSDPEHIREEIGDLFFILTMLTTMYEEQGHFGIDEALAGIAENGPPASPCFRRHDNRHGPGAPAAVGRNQGRGEGAPGSDLNDQTKHPVIRSPLASRCPEPPKPQAIAWIGFRIG